MTGARGGQVDGLLRDFQTYDELSYKFLVISVLNFTAGSGSNNDKQVDYVYLSLGESELLLQGKSIIE